MYQIPLRVAIPLNIPKLFNVPAVKHINIRVKRAAGMPTPFLIHRRNHLPFVLLYYILFAKIGGIVIINLAPSHINAPV